MGSSDSITVLSISNELYIGSSTIFFIIYAFLFRNSAVVVS